MSLLLEYEFPRYNRRFLAKRFSNLLYWVRNASTLQQITTTLQVNTFLEKMGGGFQP